MKGKPHTRKTWSEFKSAYCRGEGTIADLAPRFGISQSIAEKRCAKERWKVQRQQVGEKAEEKAREADVESLATMLSKHRRFANKLIAAAEKRLDEAIAAGKVSGHLLDDIAQVLARVARQERLAAGIEPAKPVMAFETAGAGTVLRVKRPRNPAVAELPPAPTVQALPPAKAG